MTQDIEQFHFNKAVARLYELTNAISAYKGGGAALREALRSLTLLIGPMMPHLSEEMWQALGGVGLSADQPWPGFGAALAYEDVVTIAVQVSGKLRATLQFPRDMDRSELEAAALANDNVVRAIDGKTVRKVIVVQNRIVNVVV